MTFAKKYLAILSSLLLISGNMSFAANTYQYDDSNMLLQDKITTGKSSMKINNNKRLRSLNNRITQSNELQTLDERLAKGCDYDDVFCPSDPEEDEYDSNTKNNTTLDNRYKDYGTTNENEFTPLNDGMISNNDNYDTDPDDEYMSPSVEYQIKYKGSQTLDDMIK